LGRFMGARSARDPCHTPEGPTATGDPHTRLRGPARPLEVGTRGTHRATRAVGGAVERATCRPPRAALPGPARVTFAATFCRTLQRGSRNSTRFRTYPQEQLSRLRAGAQNLAVVESDAPQC